MILAVNHVRFDYRRLTDILERVDDAGNVVLVNAQEAFAFGLTRFAEPQFYRPLARTTRTNTLGFSAHALALGKLGSISRK